MYITVKYTDDTRDSRMEDKKMNGRIQHAPYSLDLAPFDFAFFPPTEVRICMESGLMI